MMRRCVIFCGAPASGKRTCARSYASDNGCALINLDTVSERLVVAGLCASGHDGSDRDSDYYKSTYRNCVYETMFAVAKENIEAGIDVVLVGPFTRELQMPQWPNVVRARLGGSPEVSVIYVTCEESVRKSRMERRAESRDRSKLEHWKQHCDGYSAPRCPHTVLDNSAERPAAEPSQRLQLSMDSHGKSLPRGDHPLQRPSFFIVRQLTARPFWERSELSPEVLQVVEYLEVVSEQLLLESQAVRHLRQSELAGGTVGASGGSWSVVDIEREGVISPGVSSLCPCACAALHLAACCTGQRFSACLFSYLARGGVIKQHFGPTNLRLRVIMALRVPRGSASLYCAGQRASLTQGRALVFDDSFQHGSDFVGEGDPLDERVCLIVDVFHPELTLDERRYISDIIKSTTG